MVRRLVVYDRFEGRRAWESLAQLYRVFRKYVNFFQPSLKLIQKERTGAKVSKKYDKAKTPYQRILLSTHISQAKKELLRDEYQRLDPVDLLRQLEMLQDQLWQYSWSKSGNAEVDADVGRKNDVDVVETSSENTSMNRFYRANKTKKPILRTWRTRKDPFENVWDEIRLRLELIPEMTAKETIKWLMDKYPDQYNVGQIRTLQRRFAEWRQGQLSQEARLRALMVDEKSELSPLVETLIGNIRNEHGEAEHPQ